MTRREKVIVTLTACCAFAALVYAGVSGLGESEDTDVSERVDEVAALLPVVQAQLAQSDLRDDELAVLDQLNGPWGPDPFSNEAALWKTTAEKESVQVAYSYTGYLEIGTKRICIINDREYETGMWLEDGTHRIRSITASRVTLVPADSEGEVILELVPEE